MATMHMKNDREDYLVSAWMNYGLNYVTAIRPFLLPIPAHHSLMPVLSCWSGENQFLSTTRSSSDVTRTTGEPLDVMTQAFLAYYFHTADGTQVSEQWIAFSGLPDGQFYASAFQGYTGNELAKVFGNDLEMFTNAADNLGGRPYKLGDAAFIFQALPLVPILAVGWQGDEDFAPSYRLLFDKNINHHLPTDACAILGSTLTRRLIKTQEKLATKLDQSNGSELQ